MDFDTLLDLGLTILNDFASIGTDIVQAFTTKLEEHYPIIEGTALGEYSLIQIMFTVGLPLFLSFVIVKWVLDFIP